MTSTKPAQEHPLANILINVLIPVLALSYLSKDPALQEKIGKTAKAWHIGPLPAMLVALALPIGYGIWHFVKTRKPNFFSTLGIVSVLLTGCLTLYLWNPDGTVKDNAGLLFGIKEGLIPLVLGIAILKSFNSPSPLLNVFLYNDNLFDIPKIERRVADAGRKDGYQLLLLRATRLFAASFFISSAMNVGLALYFFSGFEARAVDALEKYNGIIASLTGWGFAVIGIPILIFLFFTLRFLLKGLSDLTGYKTEELTMSGGK